MFLKSEFSNRLVQISLFSALVYYITAYPVVFEKARKYFPVKFKKTHHLLIFHSLVFAVLMYVLTYFLFDPIVRVVEGSDNQTGTCTIRGSFDEYGVDRPDFSAFEEECRRTGTETDCNNMINNARGNNSLCRWMPACVEDPNTPEYSSWSTDEKDCACPVKKQESKGSPGTFRCHIKN